MKLPHFLEKLKLTMIFFFTESQSQPYSMSNQFMWRDKLVKDKFECRLCQNTFENFISLCEHFHDQHKCMNMSFITKDLDRPRHFFFFYCRRCGSNHSNSL
jgi:hypothetical protein